MFSEKTKCIDIIKLERETQKFLYIGFIIGIVFISSLELIYLFRKPAYYITSEISIRKPIRAELITIPSETETPEPPVIKQKQQEDKQIIIEEKKVIEPSVAEIADSLKKVIPEERIESILKQPRKNSPISQIVMIFWKLKSPFRIRSSHRHGLYTLNNRQNLKRKHLFLRKK